MMGGIRCLPSDDFGVEISSSSSPSGSLSERTAN